MGHEVGASSHSSRGGSKLGLQREFKHVFHEPIEIGYCLPLQAYQFDFLLQHTLRDNHYDIVKYFLHFEPNLIGAAPGSIVFNPVNVNNLGSPNSEYKSGMNRYA